MVKARVGAVWKRSRANEPWLLEVAFLFALTLFDRIHLQVFGLFGGLMESWEWSFLNHVEYAAGLSLRDVSLGMWCLAALYFLVVGTGHALTPRLSLPASGRIGRTCMALTCFALAVASAFFMPDLPRVHARSELVEDADSRFVEYGNISAFCAAVGQDLPGAARLCDSLLTDSDASRRLYGAVVRYHLGRRDEFMLGVIRESMTELMPQLEADDSEMTDAALNRVAMAVSTDSQIEGKRGDPATSSARGR